jgi:hypothetical protein
VAAQSIRPIPRIGHWSHPKENKMLFDDSNVAWLPVGDFKYFVASVLHIDAERGIVDFILKYDANQRIVTHRHLADGGLFVVQGEHRIYEPDGVLREIRPVGRYTWSPASAEPHSEGGGDEGAVVLYSMRPDDASPIFELLDDEGNSIAVLGIDFFRDFQRAALSAGQ